MRLRGLVEAGLLTRTAYGEIPPRVEYEPTPKLKELTPIFGVLEEWASKNDLTSPRVVSTVGRPTP